MPSRPTSATNPDRAQRPAAKPVPTPPRRPKFPKSWTIPEGFYEAALWGNSKARRPWTETVIRAAWRLRDKLEEARDIEDFCPGYDKAKKRQRSLCWLRLVSGVAKEESAFDPRMTYREPMGQLSIGLLQLSDGECILNGDTAPDLRDPVKNLKCGVAIMADLIKRDRYIDGPIWARGAASYWSTLRSPYVFLGLRLGKRPAIVNYCRNYRSYSTD